MIRSTIAAVLAALLLTSATTAQAFEYYPGATYDSEIPTLEKVVGHDWGARITSHAEMERYLRALAASTERVSLVEYGKSWEGKPLYYLVVGRAQTVADTARVKAGMQRLADPRGLDGAEAKRLVDELPAIVWLAYSVHGDEISCTDAATLCAYHLVAAQNDEVATKILDNCLVLIDPLQNPDGRDRFVHHFRQTRGRWPDADPNAVEHVQPWPGGRTNHYLFDMNRDWIAITQPESKARVKAFLEWYPLIYVDLHEMGSNSTYYFAPPPEPYNPQFTKSQIDWLETVGRNNAKWFDRFRFDYFTREVFDAFYPGYGEGWPMFHGAIGLTYEQAGVRGLIVERDDKTKLAYKDSVKRHFIASIATAETAADRRKEMVQHFLDFRRGAIEKGESGDVREFFLTGERDRGRTEKLVRRLMAQGIEVRRAKASFRASNLVRSDGDEVAEREFGPGTYSVSLAQPAGRLAATLLSRHQALSESFVKEQDRRRKKRLSTEIYDVTAWSLPLLYDVACYETKELVTADFELLTAPPEREGTVRETPAKLAYVVNWGTQAAARALASMFRQKIRVHCADKPFELGGRDFSAGSLIVKTKGNPDDLHARVAAIAKESGVEFYATDSSWVTKGINFGSNNVQYLERPKIALAYRRPVSPYSAGWTRFLLEREFGYPVHVVPTRVLAAADLSKYNVIVLPQGRGYGDALGKVSARIKEWVRAGGTLVTFAEATRWLSSKGVGLLATEREYRDGAKGAKSKDVKPTSKPTADAKSETKDDSKKDDAKPFDLNKAIQPEKELPDRTPGAILRVDLDPEHWLAFGYDSDTNVLVQSRNIFTPVKLDKGRNVGVYAKPERLVLSGHTWKETARQIAQKAYLVHQPLGKGHVVAFAEDPNFRGLCDGLNLLFLNAVFFGPGH